MSVTAPPRAFLHHIARYVQLHLSRCWGCAELAPQMLGRENMDHRASWKEDRAHHIHTLAGTSTYQKDDDDDDFGYMPRGTNGALRHGILYNAK